MENHGTPTHRLDVAAETALVRPTRPTHLHVANSWPPGVRPWIEDFAAADRDAESLLLESVGSDDCRGIRLRLLHLASRTTIGNWTLRLPISEVRSHHEEYSALVADVCRNHAVDHLYVSSLLGHSLDVFRTGTPATRIYHDGFPYCPAFFFTRDALCRSCNREDLRKCARHKGLPRPKNSPQYYEDLRDAYFESVAGAHVRHVSPTASLPRHLRSMDSRWLSIDFRVIPPGSSGPKRDSFGGAEEGRRLRIGIPQYSHWHGGSESLHRIFDVLRTLADVYLLGTPGAGAEYQRRWGAYVVDTSQPHGAPPVLDRLRLDLMLFLPLVPMPFSHDLQNAVRSCIPPAAHGMGIFEEKIDHGSNGFLLRPDDHDVIDFALWADRERGELRRISAALRDAELRTVEREVADYNSLRSELSEIAP